MNQQRGTSVLGTLIFAILLGFAGLFALKVGTLYYDHFIIQGMVDDLKLREAELSTQTERQIKRDLSTKLRINGMDDLVPIERFVFARNGAQWVLDVEYERRTQLMDQIDIVVKFQTGTELGQP